MAQAKQDRWEYHGIAADSEADLMRGLNEAGLEGWELVSICSCPGKREATWMAFLKRLSTGQPPLKPKTSDTTKMKAPESETKKQSPGDDTSFDVNTDGPEASGEGFDLQL